MFNPHISCMAWVPLTSPHNEETDAERWGVLLRVMKWRDSGTWIWGCSAEARPLPITPRPGVEALLLPHFWGSRFSFSSLLLDSLPIHCDRQFHSSLAFPKLRVCSPFSPSSPPLPQHEDSWRQSTWRLHSPSSFLAVPLYTFSVSTTLNSLPSFSYACQRLPFWKSCSWTI